MRDLPGFTIRRFIPVGVAAGKGFRPRICGFAWAGCTAAHLYRNLHLVYRALQNDRLEFTHCNIRGMRPEYRCSTITGKVHPGCKLLGTTMNNHMLAIFQLLVLGGIVFFVVLMAQAQPVSSGTGHWSCSDKTLPSGHNSGNAAPDAGLGGSAPAFLRGIGLSNDQQAAISGIIDAQAPKLRAREQGIRTAQQSLQALVASGQYNAAQAQSLARSMSADLAAMMLMDAESDHRIYQLLTNDQRRQIEQMKASGKYRPVCSADGKPRTLVRII